MRIQNATEFKKIFPSGTLANSDPAYLLSRKMTEWNLTNIIRMITDKDSFVITKEFDSSKDFEFCVNGYYFCIGAGTFQDVTGITPQDSNVFVGISVTREEDSINDGYSEISEIEFAETLQGLTSPDYTLQLLSSGQVPDSSLIKFTYKSLELSEELLNIISDYTLSNIQVIDGNVGRTV